MLDFRLAMPFKMRSVGGEVVFAKLHIAHSALVAVFAKGVAVALVVLLCLSTDLVAVAIAVVNKLLFARKRIATKVASKVFLAFESNLVAVAAYMLRQIYS